MLNGQWAIGDGEQTYTLSRVLVLVKIIFSIKKSDYAVQ